MGSGMAMASFTIKMEACMMESGDRIRWREMVNCIISLANWPMMATGRMISLWAKVYYTIKYHKYSTKHSITMISTKWTSTGPNIKVYFIIFRIIRRRYEKW